MGVLLALIFIGALAWWFRDIASATSKQSPRTKALRIVGLFGAGAAALLLLRSVFRGGIFVGAGFALAAVIGVVVIWQLVARRSLSD